MYKLPDNWKIFYDEIIKKTKELIKVHYFDDIKQDDLILWLSNFDTDEEKFLSSLLLYKLIYRSEESLLSMYRHIVDILLPNILEKKGLYTITSIEKFHEELKNKYTKLPFVFSTVEFIDDDPAKSGHQLLRLFARKGSFHNNRKISVKKLAELNKDIVKAIVIFDDIVGTGEQFLDYLKATESFHKDFLFIYFPLAASFDALEHIKKEYEGIIIQPVEIFDEDNFFFSKKGFPKHISEELDIEWLKKVYIDLMKRKTFLKEKSLLGYGDKSLTYFLNISAPNNSLEIFTYKDQNWHNLFNR